MSAPIHAFADQATRPLRDPCSGAPIRVGVMGSASQEGDPAWFELCRRLGQVIARCGCSLLTGACPGLPQAAVLGAKEEGGTVIGISPARSLREHIQVFESPYEEFDSLIFTGLGLMGRELVNIHSSDIVVVAGGRSGTLGEFAIAYEEGKLIGVLTGTGGITASLAQLERQLHKESGAEVIYAPDPGPLIEALLGRYLSRDYACPCHPDGDGCGKDCSSEH